MLQSKPSTDAQEIPAAQVRVKADELARAIAAIEARKQERARLLEGTVAVGDAVKELQLEETSEEILAEVQAQRVERQVEGGQEEERHQSSGLLPKLRVAALAAAVASLGAAVANHFYRTAALNPRGPVTAARLSATDDGITSAVSAIPDGKPFYCLPSEVQELFDKVPQARIQVVQSPAYSAYEPWALIKHGGNVYVRGWVSAPTGSSLTSSKSLFLYNISPDRDSALNHDFTPITLRLGTLAYQGFYQRLSLRAHSPHNPAQDDILVVSDPRPDKFAWEKW